MDTSTPFKNQHYKHIATSDVDELAFIQKNKNRRYTQLQPGQLNGVYTEVNLGDVQVFREQLTTGALIEASPIASFVPFAAVISNRDDFKFCGKKREKNTLLQATGGHWDAHFSNNLSFVVAAFNREKLNHSLTHLFDHEIPAHWLVSQQKSTTESALWQYTQGLEKILRIVSLNPHLASKKSVKITLSQVVLKLALNTLLPGTHHKIKLKPKSTRMLGVKRVIDYLHSYANQLPSVAELCKVANLSERSLQYGFKEYLGITPIRYLRLIRLNGVRRDLLSASQQQTKVIDIALNWGFVELGRFASEYRQLFSELPSQTLQKQQLHFG